MRAVRIAITEIQISRLLLAFIALLATAPSVAAPAASISQTFKRVDNSVVVVRTRERVVSRNSAQQEVSAAGLGSGVIVSDSLATDQVRYSTDKQALRNPPQAIDAVVADIVSSFSKA